MPDRSGKGIAVAHKASSYPQLHFLSGLGLLPLILVGLIFFGLLFSGCKTMPELYRTSVEAAVGRGDLNLVVPSPDAYPATGRVVSSFLADMGISDSESRKILERSDRIALALDGNNMRIALSGDFPAFLIRLGTKESRKEDASYRIEVPYSGLVLVSSGDHRWMQREWTETPEDPFLIPSAAPGAIYFSLREPAVLYRIDRKGYFLNMAEYNALNLVEGAALPISGGGGWRFRAEMKGSDEDGSRRIASVMKTALFSLSRAKDDRALSHTMAEIAGAILRDRALERDGLMVILGPVEIEEKAVEVLLESLKENP